MAAHTFLLKQLIPVRVGTEVEITTFYEPKTSAWDGSITGHEDQVAQDHVVLRDLDTGIVYGAPWHFHGADVHPKLVAATTIRGRVVACQVRTGARNDGDIRGRTWLAIEAAGSVYR